MNYTERLENVSVLGAAGKMGSGILLLTAAEMTDLNLLPENNEKIFVLNAIDVSDKALEGLKNYIETQVRKIAEKKIVFLRKAYEDRNELIENADIINQYIFDVVNKIRLTTSLASAYNSTLVFEAVNENPDLKVKLLTEIKNNNKRDPWYFTNTSSVPINRIDREVGLNGKILGFHFYNPPAIQKLAELIVDEKTDKEMIEFAKTYAKNLRKIIVPSNDIAGFIGNGHFMRDALFGIKKVEELTNETSSAEAIFIVNKVSQDFLIRPMGIFQLIDYVGIDVVKYIMEVMNPYLDDENLHSKILDEVMNEGILGGQRSDGSQKDGFLQYEKGRIVGVLDLQSKKYVEVDKIIETCNEKLGPLPEAFVSWKSTLGDREKEKRIKAQFEKMEKMDTFGANLALNYALNSRKIALKLVNDKVAQNEEDVNTVLLTGFFHAYGPINNYLNWEDMK